MLQKLEFPAAELYIQGAHLTGYKDWLYLSSRSHFAEGKAIRGGIPVIFPWFGPKQGVPNAPQHGWARTAQWQIESQSSSDIALTLSQDNWLLQLQYAFSDTLSVRADVQNLGTIPRSFELALHSYFAVSDVTSVEIEGLDSLTYIDKTQSNERFVQNGKVHFGGEVDRVYLRAPSPLRILDGAHSYELRGNWASAVTWNPGATKAVTMSDLGTGEWQNFVCLEVGALADDAIELASQEIWTMSAEISRI